MPRAAWLAQPAYLVVEVALAVLTGVDYSLRDDTISALGTSCAPGEGGCSSAPALMSLTFVVFGVLQAWGALPLLRSATAGRGQHVVGWLWVVAGVGSVGVGLLPVDRYPLGHSLAALPVFLAQPLALLLHARLLGHGRLRRAGFGLTTVAAAGLVGFVALLGSDHWSGALERAAIWPAKLWLPLVVLAMPGWRRAPDAPPPGPPRGGTGPANPPTARGR
jgi:hypothetical protein